MLVPLQAVAARCLKVLLSQWRVRFGAGLPVPLQGIAAGCRSFEGAAFWSCVCVSDVACWCRYKVPLECAT